jgi:hypothetical protein
MPPLHGGEASEARCQLSREGELCNQRHQSLMGRSWLLHISPVPFLIPSPGQMSLLSRMAFTLPSYPVSAPPGPVLPVPHRSHSSWPRWSCISSGKPSLIAADFRRPFLKIFQRPCCDPFYTVTSPLQLHWNSSHVCCVRRVWWVSEPSIGREDRGQTEVVWESTMSLHLYCHNG